MPAYEYLRVAEAFEEYLRRSEASPAELVTIQRKAKLSRIMKRAWEISRIAAVSHGGTARSYFAEALKLAWAVATGALNWVTLELSMMRIQIHALNAPSQREYGHKGRAWYAAAVGW